MEEERRGHTVRKEGPLVYEECRQEVAPSEALAHHRAGGAYQHAPGTKAESGKAAKTNTGAKRPRPRQHSSCT